MKHITTIENLRNAIQQLEVERATSASLLKEQFRQTCESFKPVNLLFSVVRGALSTPHLIDDTFVTVVGLAAGSLTRKIVVGKSDNNLLEKIGKIMGNGITNLVAQHPETIKAIGRYIFSFFSTKREANSDNQ